MTWEGLWITVLRTASLDPDRTHGWVYMPHVVGEPIPDGWEELDECVQVRLGKSEIRAWVKI